MNAFKLIMLIGLGLLGAISGFLFTLPNQVLIESLESKTINGDAVFNRIRLESNSQQDVWRMAQSHHGINHPPGQWDELKIIVDKSQRPYKATYQQWYQGKQVEFRVSCFMCHANGPRAIRPVNESQDASLTLRDRALIALWNVRIKTYGQVMAQNENNDEHKGVPLAFSSPFDREVLKVKTCLQCHQDSPSSMPWKRWPLMRQHAVAISFMLEQGLMPPFPYTISAQEKAEIERFVQGI
jgi:cytochrome c5